MSILSKRILLVEEVEGLRKTLGQWLMDLGYAVSEANAGIEALYKAATELPDLIIIGAELPQLTGIDVTTWLKRHDSTKDIPVLMMHALNPRLKDEVKALHAGALAAVNHPETLDQLRTTLKQCFSLPTKSRDLVVSRNQ